MSTLVGEETIQEIEMNRDGFEITPDNHVSFNLGLEMQKAGRKKPVFYFNETVRYNNGEEKMSTYQDCMIWRFKKKELPYKPVWRPMAKEIIEVLPKRIANHPEATELNPLMLSIQRNTDGKTVAAYEQPYT